MAKSYDSTITDKKNFSCNVIDKKKFESLEQMEKELFECLRNSMLEIYPTEKGNTYSDEAIRYAENFAFIATKGVLKIIDKKLEDIIEDMTGTLTEDILNQVKMLMSTQVV